MKTLEGIVSFSTEQLEETTSKTTVAGLMQTTRATIQKYDKLAMKYLNEYCDEYPIIDHKHLTVLPLTKYQCWVLQKLLVESLKYTYKGVEAKLIASDGYKDKFSFKMFSTKDTKVSFSF
ncbi:MAG: hypothetical protein KME28_20420 [Pelatocladus maniniholoensis HA4357-MV3]|jgi:hypothetical protein|uniref:Uncharacterized protein n=1 Tax=Pelatocladus maniniholoensis HA4357-MV3 TaxID=1117104 RepID=A0A9E3LV49_9NOST|nr:hypothetical protein [Pelatocladus maniniholoensis HA4357-MV3]